jgi:hypothetical protein
MATPSYLPERAQRQVSQKDNTPTSAAITTIWATMRNELLPAKTNYARPTITTTNQDLCTVDHSSSLGDIIR